MTIVSRPSLTLTHTHAPTHSYHTRNSIVSLSESLLPVQDRHVFFPHITLAYIGVCFVFCVCVCARARACVCIFVCMYLCMFLECLLTDTRAYGSVYKAIHKDSQFVIALKVNLSCPHVRLGVCSPFHFTIHFFASLLP